LPVHASFIRKIEGIILSADFFATANPSHRADIGKTIAWLPTPIFLPPVIKVDRWGKIELGVLGIFDIRHGAPSDPWSGHSCDEPAHKVELKSGRLDEIAPAVAAAPAREPGDLSPDEIMKIKKLLLLPSYSVRLADTIGTNAHFKGLTVAHGVAAVFPPMRTHTSSWPSRQNFTYFLSAAL
jgi:hypothetical protein